MVLKRDWNFLILIHPFNRQTKPIFSVLPRGNALQPPLVCSGRQGHHLWSDVIVREGAGQLAVGLGLGEQCVGLALEGLHGVCAGSEASWRLLEGDELHEGVSELCGVTTLLPIHALPGSDYLLS